MIKNYLKIAWRNLLKHKIFSLINIIGLAVSMSVCLLIILIIADQNSYDDFHKKKDRIYRIQTHGKDGNRQTASTAFPLAENLKKEYAGIEQATTLVRGIGGDIFYKNKIATGAGYFSDGTLFEIFDFQLSQGDAKYALKEPFSLVISENLSSKLFGKENPIDKTVRFNDKQIVPGEPQAGNRETEYGLFKITGVLKPNSGKTHLPFDLLASTNTLPNLSRSGAISFSENDWSNVWSNYAYVLLNKGQRKSDLQRMLGEVSAKIYDELNPDQYIFKATGLMEITPSDPIGNMTSVTLPLTVIWILSVLCLIVIFSACLNYTNLSIARSLTRAKEVGVRMVMGARSRHIFLQFISEAVLVSLLALLVSIGILQLIKLGFTHLWLNQFFNITFEPKATVYLIFIGFSVVVGLVAGLLPSFYLSRFNPSESIKNFKNVKVFQGLTLRKVLLVVQFSFSLIFIISTVLIFQQTRHIFNFNYGFDQKNVVNVKLYKVENYQRFVSAVSGHKDIVAISACAFLPATNTNYSSISYTVDRKDSLQTSYIDIDAKCLEVWDLKLIAGKNLPEFSSTNIEQYVLMNEIGVKGFNFGSNAQAVGQKILVDGNAVEIVGVVKDFQFNDVTRRMRPLILRNRQAEFGYATIKISGKNTARTLAFLEQSWTKVNPKTKFEYQFFDQQLLFTHSLLQNAASILGVLCFLAVFISCLGLLGMATYTAETRIREVAIRKVLGSGVTNILMLLSKGFAFQLLIATIIATPLAYLVNDLWLNFFASRVSISAFTITLSIGALLFISLLIVLSQAWRAAVANPVKSLKTE